MEKNIFFFLKYSIYLFPVLLITGSFLPDLILSISVILFIILIFKKREFEIFKNLYFQIYFIFIIYLIIRSLFTLDWLSIRPSLFYFRFGFFSLAIFYLLKKNIVNIKFFTIISSCLLIIIFLDANLQSLTGKNVLGFELYHPERISSFFKDELILGGTTFRIFSMIVPLMFFLNFKRKFIFSILVFLLMIYTILLSSERTPVGLMIIYILAFLFFVPIKVNNKIIFAVIITSFISIFFYLHDESRNRIINKTLHTLVVDKKKYNVTLFSSMHQSHILTSIEMFKDNYLFGKGPKMYRKVCDDTNFKKFIVGAHSCTTHPHNILAQFLGEIGLVGLLFLIIFYSKIIQVLFKNIFSKHSKDINFPIKLLSISVLLNFFPFIPYGNFFNNWLSMISYLPIPFLMFIYYDSANNRKQ